MYLIIIAPLSMYKGRRSRSFEEDFPHHNWFIVVLVLPFVSNTGYLMLTPSIYQFVTTSRSLPEELENTEVCGLSTVKTISLIKHLVIRACDLACSSDIALYCDMFCYSYNKTKLLFAE